VGFPIRKSSDQRSFASFPKLIAGCRVLHRLSIPRHPPYTLCSLTIFIECRRQRACRRGAGQRAPAPPITGHNRRKGAQRHQNPPPCPARGITRLPGTASDSGVRCPTPAAENGGDLYPKNLTYSLVKELLGPTRMLRSRWHTRRPLIPPKRG
jgi:hypothetical protein